MAKNFNWAIFFDDFEVKYLQITNFSEKQISFKLKVIFSTNFRPKTKKIVRVVFEKNIKASDFGLIWRPFREYLQLKNFFQKSGSVTLKFSKSSQVGANRRDCYNAQRFLLCLIKLFKEENSPIHTCRFIISGIHY